MRQEYTALRSNPGRRPPLQCVRVVQTFHIKRATDEVSVGQTVSKFRKPTLVNHVVCVAKRQDLADR